MAEIPEIKKLIMDAKISAVDGKKACMSPLLLIFKKPKIKQVPIVTLFD